jgi:hypothetical protein
LPISFSRGCVNECNFCSEQQAWAHFRHIPVLRVVEDLEHFISRYNIRAFYICDNLINFNPNWLEELCDLIIANKIDVTFTLCFIQARKMSPGLIDKMVNAGFSRVSIGVDHGSQRMLDLMNKKTNLDEIRQILIDCVESGLSVYVSTIVNFPGETIGDLISMIRFFREIDEILLNLGISAKYLPGRNMTNNFRLDPSSRMYNNAEHFGIEIVTHQDLDKIVSKKATQLNKKTVFRGEEDASFHKYLASHFGFGSDAPWQMRPQQIKRFAANISELIDVERDTFSLGDHIFFAKSPNKETIDLHNYNEVYHLNDKQLSILRDVLRKMTIKQCLESLRQGNYVDLSYIKTFIGILFVKQVLYFDRVCKIRKD